jgi:cell wall-associated NlpC family hydrolase
VRNLGIASLLTCLSLSLSSHPSWADETLNLQLPAAHPPSSGPSAAAASGERPGSGESKQFEDYIKRAQPKTSGHALASRGGYPAGRPTNQPGGKPSTEKVVGRLAMVPREAVIKATRGGRRALAKVKSGTYIAISSESGNWYGVLMSDRSTGWVSKDDVQILNYEVVSNREAEPAPYRDYASGGGSALLSGGQKALLDYAYTFLGVPYKWGGTSPNGLDCSAFVQRCFATQGIGLPRTAHEQIACGMPVSPEDLRAGDRLYFASSDGHISHTGIYVGNGYFIHSSSSHHGVAVSNLSDALYRKMYAGARR